ncbi:MAG: FAD-dependent thymidylate synthase [Oscillospiraceae bacterium]|nr:FAD-dependent thymidylate synthase [Oscillospiraceae bacterium]MBQ5990436.1 FAD-dependent thymidylate synthase [Oscillospiraceae bacterium]MBR6922987.1 FAD-dependent thymidylate synthase [Oscillospiraceae bacterium]
MKVTLITHTPDPEKTIATAAKLCYSPCDIDTISDDLTPEKIESFVTMLASIGHESVMEHVSFTFGIEGISRACSHQLVRHRIASYSQKSQRYVNEDGFEFITPPEIAADAEAKAEFDRSMAALTESYSKIASILTEKHTKTFMEQGMEEKEARSKAVKKANEDARFVLPNACETKIVVTMNVRSLFNFFRHRCCSRAQWEIKAVADEMLKLCREVAPNVFKNAGPSCLAGKCPEGKMTCGKINEMKEFYRNL